MGDGAGDVAKYWRRGGEAGCRNFFVAKLVKKDTGRVRKTDRYRKLTTS